MFLLKPTACEPAVRHDMMEVAKFLTELAVIDYHFAPLKPSSVGLAALMTAMEGVAEERLAMVDKQNFATNVYHIAQVSPNDPEVMDCRTRLRTMYYEGGIYQQQQEDQAAAAQVNRERMLAVDRIAAESPTGVDAHPVVQVDGGTNQSAARKKDGSWVHGTVAAEATLAQSQAILDAVKASSTSGGSSSSSTLEANASKDNKTTEADTEDEAPETPASTCTTMADKAKKLVQDALCSYQKTEAAKKRRKN